MSALTKEPGVAARQKGVVLIVTLVLLVIITLVAVSSVSDVALQSRMSRNSQFGLNVYNQALSEINAQVGTMADDQTLLASAIADDRYELAAGELIMIQPGFSQAAAVEFLGEGNAISFGRTLGAGVPYRFELDSVAELDNTGAGSDQTQGLIYLGPSLQ